MSNPSILSHVSVGTNDFARARRFYEAVLATLGCRIVMEHPGAVAFGRDYPEFWVQAPFDGKAASTGNGSHFGFNAESREQVDRFYAAALANGAKPDGEPGSVHVCSMVPLTAEQFETARRLGWDLSGVSPDDLGGMNLMRAVWTNPQWEGDRS